MPVQDYTKNVYADALEEMLQTTSLEKIRISALCEKCGADRQNFYYHFKDKYALVAWIYGKDFSSAINACGGRLGVEGFTAVMQKIKDRSKFYKKVFSESSQNSLRGWLHEHSIKLSGKVLMKYTGTEFLTEEQEFMITFLSYGWLGNTIEWLNNDCPASPAEFAEMQFKMLPEILQKAYFSFTSDSDYFSLTDDTESL